MRRALQISQNKLCPERGQVGEMGLVKEEEKVVSCQREFSLSNSKAFKGK